eukprot:GFUD01002190.1.p1 GENE.GFUD01002190.1~~GFUD01002190.1.p1  ORF type:complete len:185 (+),score=48.11 GFUD01002190.1:213-767(+)
MESREERRGSTSRLVRNIINIKKLFKGRKKKDQYDPEKPCYLLDLLVEPSLFEMIFDYLDVTSISRLESCCGLMRDLVVQTSIYKRRLRRINGRRKEEESRGERRGQKEFLEEEHSQVENSRHFKKKLYQYFYRKRSDKMRVRHLKQFTPDCASCMMVETGEKTSHPGWPCDSCGRYPRTIGGY